MAVSISTVKFSSISSPEFILAKQGWAQLAEFDASETTKLRSAYFFWRNRFERVIVATFLDTGSFMILGLERTRIDKPLPKLRLRKRIPKLIPARPIPGPLTAFYQARHDYLVGETLSYSDKFSTVLSRYSQSVSSNNGPRSFIAGTRIMNPKYFSSEKDYVRHSIMQVKPLDTSGYHKEVFTTSYDYMPTLPRNDVTNVTSIAVNRVLSRIKDSDLNLGASIGEGKQTLSLLLTSLRRISRSLSALKTGDYSTACKALGLGERDIAKLTRRAENRSVKDADFLARRLARDSAREQRNLARIASGRKPVIYPPDPPFTRDSLSQGTKPSVSSLWLELQYGWKPLLGDIYAVAKLLESSQDLGIIKFVGSAKDFKSTVTESSALGWGNLESSSVIDTASYARVVIYARIKNPLLATASSIGLTNPFAVAWELVPFSFIVDWFLPIGKFLELLDVGLGWDFLSGTSSLRQLSSTKTTFRSSQARVITDEPAERLYISKNRAVLSSFPKPSGIVLKDPRSLAHFLNSAALIRQLTKKG